MESPVADELLWRRLVQRKPEVYGDDEREGAESDEDAPVLHNC